MSDKLAQRQLGNTYFSDFAARNCRNKRRFNSQAECVKSIVTEKVEVELKSYKCPLCGFWHKTKHVGEMSDAK